MDEEKVLKSTAEKALISLAHITGAQSDVTFRYSRKSRRHSGHR